MDLRQGKITLGEILRHPQARELLTRELPQFARSPLLGLAGGMTLNQILIHAKGSGAAGADQEAAFAARRIINQSLRHSGRREQARKGPLTGGPLKTAMKGPFPLHHLPRRP